MDIRRVAVSLMTSETTRQAAKELTETFYEGVFHRDQLDRPGWTILRPLQDRFLAAARTELDRTE